ncbi:sensor histidine kinase [Sphingomonas sp. 28-63-12]|uniref:sensor histidine kinase n=1 Tax=Sphingomonas sp. 28-63-12 TaxID=1970434 RepID=UPI0035A991A0
MRRWIAWLARLPTGAKLFLILSAALLPLALIALFAARQTTQAADAELVSRTRSAANESTHALDIELAGDMTALRVALNALDADGHDTPSCARAQGVFAEQLAMGARFTIADRAGQVRCGSAAKIDLPVEIPDRAGAIAANIAPEEGLVLAMAAPSGKLTAKAVFPKAMLAQIARPNGFMPPYAATLIHDGQRLTLQDLPSMTPFDRTESVALPLGINGLSFEITLRSVPISSALIVAMLLPILMWAAAAGIGWFVVDRLLIRPLRELRTLVAGYQPGSVLDIGLARSMPAQEIRELGETFRTITGTVAAHEAGLAEGLVRQTKLTREVHHRVKNNLQVISSLINFHARGARSIEATVAYASIQRRVDALAVVHRNHFAELEETRGLSLRSVIGDLASNIRANAPETAGLSIVLDLDSYLSTQDVATAVAFLLTEIVELAMMVQSDAALRISLKPEIDDAEPTDRRAVLRISSPALIDGEQLRTELSERYGRVIEGLSRQLRSKLHHDPLVGAYEIVIATTGRD